MAVVFPSMLAADFSCLKDELKRVEEAGARGVQLDVMDLHFVPNLTFGPQVIRDMRKETKLYFDVHLMIENPGKWVSAFAQAGADNVTFHIEACKSLKEAQETMQKIKSVGRHAGVALKPATPWQKIKRLLPFLDYVLVMTVEPGFGGQAFLHGMLPKIRELKAYCEKKKLKPHIQVDGGINLETATLAKAAGADCLVAGSGLFKFKTKEEMAEALRQMSA